MSLLTTPEVADRLGVTVTRVQQMIVAGRLPAEKLGRDYVVKEDDLKLVADRRPGRPSKAQTIDTASTAAPSATTRRLNKAFRDAKEADEVKASKKGNNK